MMKKLATLLFVSSLCVGCTRLGVSREKRPDGTEVVKFDATSLLSNSTLKGLQVDGVTKTTSRLLGATAGQTEPNPEAITATGTALGELIGAAAASAAKGAVKP